MKVLSTAFSRYREVQRIRFSLSLSLSVLPSPLLFSSSFRPNQYAVSSLGTETMSKGSMALIMQLACPLVILECCAPQQVRRFIS